MKNKQKQEDIEALTDTYADNEYTRMRDRINRNKKDIPQDDELEKIREEMIKKRAEEG